MLDADLTDKEINNICGRLTQNAAKIRFLQAMKLNVRRARDGRPLVNRAHYDEVTGRSKTAAPAEAAHEPAWETPV
ncbi:hypothetical protein D9M73_94250 [compost metagenome]